MYQRDQAMSDKNVDAICSKSQQNKTGWREPHPKHEQGRKLKQTTRPTKAKQPSLIKVTSKLLAIRKAR